MAHSFKKTFFINIVKNNKRQLFASEPHQVVKITVPYLVADRHAAPHSERTGQKLHNKRLHLEDVLDAGAVEEADDLGYAGAGGRRLVHNQQAAGDQEDE